MAYLFFGALILESTSLPTVLMSNGVLMVLAAPFVLGWSDRFLELVAARPETIAAAHSAASGPSATTS